MKKPLNIIIMAAGMLMFAGQASAHAGDNSADAVHACTHKKTKVVRIVAATAACSGKETAMHWNITGPAGANGANGVPGSVGPTGATGAAGPKGDSGTGALPSGGALAAVLDDITNEISVSQQPGTCNSNPYPATFDSTTGQYTALNPPCSSAITQCPSGTISASNTCDVLPPNNAEKLAILDQLSQVSFSPVTDLGKPFTKAASKVGAALAKNKLECSSGKFETKGYTPWCFFKIGNVTTPPTGVVYATPVKGTNTEFINNVLTLKSTINLSAKGDLLRDDQGTPIEITQQQLNNPTNYDCHAIDFQATARCVTEPTNLLNKLLN